MQKLFLANYPSIRSYHSLISLSIFTSLALCLFLRLHLSDTFTNLRRPKLICLSNICLLEFLLTWRLSARCLSFLITWTLATSTFPEKVFLRSSQTQYRKKQQHFPLLPEVTPPNSFPSGHVILRGNRFFVGFSSWCRMTTYWRRVDIVIFLIS